ncbi:MAG: hypothetical protein ACKN9F_03385 [Methylomonas sp.]
MKMLSNTKRLFYAVIFSVSALIVSQSIVSAAPVLRLNAALEEIKSISLEYGMDFVTRFEISPEIVDFATIAGMGLVLFCLSCNRSVVSNRSYRRKVL